MKERTRGILSLISGILIVLSILENFIFENVSTRGILFYFIISLLLPMGLYNIYLGYKKIKK